MTHTKLEHVKRLAHKLTCAINDLQHTTGYDTTYQADQHRVKEGATVRRISMELTRALSDLRRPG